MPRAGTLTPGHTPLTGTLHPAKPGSGVPNASGCALLSGAV